MNIYLIIIIFSIIDLILFKKYISHFKPDNILHLLPGSGFVYLIKEYVQSKKTQK